jgi:hypothetical protein
MNRLDMMLLLFDGKKVTHTHFPPDEWVMLGEKPYFLLADGSKLTSYDFWADKKSPSWREGWSEWKDS